MLFLILIAVFGLVLAYFATINTAAVSINFGTYRLDYVPLYLVVMASLTIGLVMSGILYLVKNLSASLTIREKEGQLKKLKNELTEVTKEVHKLELENTKLKAEQGKEDIDEDAI